MVEGKGLSRYMNLFTDYAFKRLFGTEQQKDLLIDFINTVLDGEHRVVDLQYRNSERLGLVEEDRKVIFDLLCENDRGEMILVELQQARETFFQDRALYYASGLIQEQGIKGKWDYRLKATYVVAILNFELEPGPKCTHRVYLHNQTTNTRWSNSLQMVFLEIPKAPAALEQCKNHFERWMFLLGHLHQLSDRPLVLQEAVFLRLFEICEIGKFPEAERIRYQANLSEVERMENAIKYAVECAVEKAVEKTQEQAQIRVIQSMLQEGLSWEQISRITKVTEAEWPALLARK